MNYNEMWQALYGWFNTGKISVPSLVAHRPAHEDDYIMVGDVKFIVPMPPSTDPDSVTDWSEFTPRAHKFLAEVGLAIECVK